ncbi:UbiA prenyltransferase [Thermoproteus uzoniensis 768-20]|uniref:UbiA prenyltransferase n=1 Tax=Thermoproteus uzoniensis (strain 768-20) TaxID=999630 RepID=F2L568_THEU7|nr:geranylgeranylglycerol-phosphate geranylgeranyltransferase [Thermoproteus uzoniensis]AEA13493.1 UbiA prenyltransferase [Thermoproteus uzoniensis 768-20]
MRQYWRLIRGEHGVLTAISSVASYIIAGGRAPLESALIGASAFLAEAGMFAHNDLANLQEDRVNRPDAPLVTGAVSVRAAKAVAVASYLLGLILASFLTWQALTIYLVAAALGALYNEKGKRVPFVGNFIVAFLTSMVYPYGMAAAGAVDIYLLLLFAASLLANFGRELVKTAIDYPGDLAAGVRTAATVLGPRRAADLGAYFALASSTVGIYLAYALTASGMYVLLAGVASTTAALIVLSILCIRGRWQLFRRGSLAAFGITLIALLAQGVLIAIF